MLASPSRFSARFLIGATILAAPAAAQSAFAKALPQDTIFYLSVPDTRASFEEFKSTALWKMWREPSVQDFFADAIGMATEQWEQGLEQARAAYAQGQLPFDPDELVKLRPPHSLSFALTRLSLSSPEGPVETLIPRVGLVVQLDFGDTAPLWRELLETGVGLVLQRAGDRVTQSEREIAGSIVRTFAPTKNAAAGQSIELAWVGSSLVLGTIGEDVDRLLTGLQTGAGGLAETASFKRVASQLRIDGAEAEFYMRPGGLLDFATDTLELLASMDRLPPELDIAGIDRVIRTLGLRAIDGIGATSSYVDGRGVGEMFIDAPKSARTGLLADTTGAADRSKLRWIPKDASSFSIGRMDLGNVYRTLVAALRSYDEQLAEGILGQLAQVEDQLGASIEKDIFAALGDEYVSWSMPMAGMLSAPETALIVKVDDQERLLHALHVIAAQSNGIVTLDKVERQGITAYHIRFDQQALGGGNNFGGFNPFAMFQPTFGFQDGYLVGAFSTGDVKRAFQRMSREDDPSGDVRSNPEFAPLLAQIPEDAESLSFADWKVTFEAYYGIIAGFAGMLPRSEDVPFDPSLLPESHDLTQHLSGAVSWTQRTDAGLIAKSSSPFGIETLALLGGAAIAGLGVIGYARADEARIEVREDR